MNLINSFIVFLFFICTFVNNNSYLYIGDSLTCYKYGWQDKVTDYYNVESINLSKGGKRTDWMLETLKNHLLNTNNNYSKVFIYGGCNDACSLVSLESSFNNIQEMVNICNELNIQPIVILGYNPEIVMNNEKCKSRYVYLNNLLKNKLANALIIEECPYISKKDSDDGIHLNSSGHKKFSNWILSNLNNNYAK